MVSTSVTLSGWRLDNPVIAASGTCGYGLELARLYDLNCLGSLALKGTTGEPRFGNPGPRVADCPSGMLNSIGLQNPGVRAVVNEELPALAKICRKKVLANVSGFSVEEYVGVSRLFDREEQVGLIELNISCPNVHGGGLAFGADPAAAAEVTAAVREAVKKPVYVKLSPNVADIAAMAVACERAGADGISLINTLLGMRIDPASRRPVLANTFGGLSGPAIFPVALRMVWQVYEAVKIPIIGIGGVASERDLIEMMLAGATAVEIGASALKEPFLCRDIVERLPGELEKYGVNDINEMIGGAH